MPQSTKLPISPNYRFQRWICLFVDASLTIAASFLLYEIAKVYALDPWDTGLGQRYKVIGTDQDWRPYLAVTWANALMPMADDLRAALLLRTAYLWLPLLALMGWALLQLAKSGKPAALGLVIVVWGVVAVFMRPFAWPPCVGVLLASVGICLAVVSFASSSNSLRFNAKAQFRAPNFWGVCLWSGWVLFTGIAWLWIADFAARGPVGMQVAGAKYFGLRQADAIWLAHGMVFMSAAKSHAIVRAVVQLSAACAAMLARPRGWLLIALIGTLAALTLAWLGHRNDPPFSLLGMRMAGAGKPHISGELLRLAACIALAWLAYRFGERQSSGTRALRGLAYALLVLLFCSLGLAKSGDMGPLIILSLALMLLVASAVSQFGFYRAVPSGRKAQILLLLLATAMVCASIAVWRTGLSDIAPLLSKNGAAREAARQNPYDATSPNLAQSRWLMDAAAQQGGFGLGAVPYCGAKAHIGLAPCTLGSGAPLQLASDFAYVGIVATWGVHKAAVLVILLLAWLCALTLAAMPSRHAQASQIDTLLWLRAWLVAVPCLLAQAQTLLTVGGTLSWVSLSGVGLPVLGYGSTALCVVALWLGLACSSNTQTNMSQKTV